MYLLGFIGNFFQGADGIIILLIILVIFGGKKLPELARGLGSAINEFNKAKDDVHRQITQAVETPAQPAQPVIQPVATSAPHVPAEGDLHSGEVPPQPKA